MWHLEELDGEMSEYFKIIEKEASELREKIEPPSPRPVIETNTQDENTQEDGHSKKEGSESVANENGGIDWTAGPEKKLENGSLPKAENFDQNKSVQNDNNNAEDNANQPHNRPADTGAQYGSTPNLGISPGYRTPNYDLYLSGYAESERQIIRHINLLVRRQSELIEYATKILECSSLDTPVLVIQDDDELAESFSIKLCNEGFWSVPIINKTTAVSKMDNANEALELCPDNLASFRCLITTMKFLRDNCDFFRKRPSVVINFESITPRIKYLERWLNYCVSGTDSSTSENKKEEIFVYHINIPILN